ncbi:Iron/ascorbate family oxidoreductase [Handroanthus impetiginosus]|uniref:Iron/ascorbate family oxidoreductase n=1 Tax=Handroanthus impetiginosus TaxID=429701 RepID=A0A2G9HXH5_9LAMI|nr:Iron/ascorbate family oxidoreductase [Handroanthus impetiginosus]
MATAIASHGSVETVIKAVQELSTNAACPPEKYILKDGIGGTDFPVLEVPVLDFSLLTSSSPEGEKEVEKLRLGFASCGYVQAVNHGIDDSFLDEVHGLTKEFFSLPMEEKMKCARPKDDIDGYGNDTVYSDKQTIDWNDRLYLNVKPESLRKLKVWPEKPTNFKKMLLEFTAKLEKINEILLRTMAKSLKVKDEECFLKQYGENPTVLSRFNLYPPCPRPDAVLAAKAHGDASAMTYLLQDKKVEGLQTLKDGQWYRVPIIPNALVVNVGDQIEIMTNGIFKSPIHRVVTNPHKERTTIAIFCTPDPTSEVQPAEGLIDEKRPKLFKSVVDYTGNYFKSFQTGKRPIDLLRI